MPRRPNRPDDETIESVEPRSEALIEADRLKFDDITINGKKILPTNTKKYAGHLHKHYDRWRVVIKTKEYKEYKSFETRENAEAYWIEVNMKENLAKNMIYKHKNEYYCVLTQNQIMKFSKEDRKVVEAYTWQACYNRDTKSYYAKTTCRKNGKKSLSFPQALFPNMKPGDTGDHISNETLDNTRQNLREATKSEQNENRRIFSNNKSGVTGVYYDKRAVAWVAKWKSEKGRPSLSFSVKRYGYDNARELAIAARNEGVANYRKYKQTI